MKIEIEIKDDKFHYSWSLGISKETGEMELTPDGLMLFSQLISRCWKVSDDKISNKIKYLEALSLINSNRERK